MLAIVNQGDFFSNVVLGKTKTVKVKSFVKNTDDDMAITVIGEDGAEHTFDVDVIPGNGCKAEDIVADSVIHVSPFGKLYIGIQRIDGADADNSASTSGGSTSGCAFVKREIVL